MPNKMKVYNVKGHQYNNLLTVYLSMSTRLNITADKLIGKNVKAPLMTNIKNTQIVVCVNDKYILNNYI